MNKEDQTIALSVFGLLVIGFFLGFSIGCVMTGSLKQREFERECVKRNVAEYVVQPNGSAKWAWKEKQE